MNWNRRRIDTERPAWFCRGCRKGAAAYPCPPLNLEAEEAELARYLGTWLPATERPWLDYGLAVLARPARVLEPPPEPARADGQASTPPSARANAQNRARPSTPAGANPAPPHLAAAILAIGIVKLAGVQPEQAALALTTHAPTLELDPLAWDRAHAAVGQALTPIDGPRGLAIWDRMAAHEKNLEAQERRLRAAGSSIKRRRRRTGRPPTTTRSSATTPMPGGWLSRPPAKGSPMRGTRSSASPTRSIVTG